MKNKQGFNPYLPSWEYIPDAEPYVFGNRVYIYGSHDRFNGYAYCLNDYVCWSAPIDDLSDWRYEGVIYRKTDDPMNRDGHMCLYAPDVTVGPDGRYYLYYVLDKAKVVSVAVSDTPSGKYEFYGYVQYPDGTRLGEREGDEPQFDPAVLTEGDKTYLYTGFCPEGDWSRKGCMAKVLGPDMITVIEKPQPFFQVSPIVMAQVLKAMNILKPRQLEKLAICIISSIHRSFFMNCVMRQVNIHEKDLHTGELLSAITTCTLIRTSPLKSLCIMAEIIMVASLISREIGTSFITVIRMVRTLADRDVWNRFKSVMTVQFLR